MTYNEVFNKFKKEIVCYAKKEAKLTEEQGEKLLKILDKFEDELDIFFGVCSAENTPPEDMTPLEEVLKEVKND